MNDHIHIPRPYIPDVKGTAATDVAAVELLECLDTFEKIKTLAISLERSELIKTRIREGHKRSLWQKLTLQPKQFLTPDEARTALISEEPGYFGYTRWDWVETRWHKKTVRALHELIETSETGMIRMSIQDMWIFIYVKKYKHLV